MHFDLEEGLKFESLIKSSSLVKKKKSWNKSKKTYSVLADFVLKAIGKGSCGWLVDDAEHVKASDAPSILAKTELLLSS